MWWVMKAQAALDEAYLREERAGVLGVADLLRRALGEAG